MTVANNINIPNVEKTKKRIAIFQEINNIGKLQHNIITECCRQKKIKIYDFIISNINIIEINVYNKYNNNYIMMLVNQKKTDYNFVKLFLDIGININIRNYSDKSCIYNLYKKLINI